MTTKEWKQKNKVKIALYRKRYIKKNPWAKHKSLIASRCACNPHYNGKITKRKNLISTQELKKLWFRDKAWLLEKASIDRINNNGDYTYENCRFIEQRENARLGNIGLNKYRRRK